MQEPFDLSATYGGDPIAVALESVGRGGIDAIVPAFAGLRSAGIDPAGEIAQPLLIEAVFHLLEAFEQGRTDRSLCEALTGFDPGLAQAAVDLLIIANFPDGGGTLDDLGDATVLLIAALHIAAGRRADAREMLRQAMLIRLASRFQGAAIQLLLLAQDGSEDVIQLLFERTLDGLDHPEIWAALPATVARFPDLVGRIAALTGDELRFYTDMWSVIHALCVAAGGDVDHGLALVEPLATAHSQSPLVQGAVFHMKALLAPENPVYDLASRFCTTPFEVLDVLDGRSHLCCASWLPESVGDLAEEGWRGVWNSDSAESIRASIHDGSYRYCNKTACPRIAAGTLPKKADLASESARWRDIIDRRATRLAVAPERVNLAYDKTCNLSCPSCRTGKVAADSATRERFDRLQDREILPLLRHAKLVFVTGSGDPFASKNFRTLLDRLGPEDYPELRFQIMTNGMLFTPREWERFPSLHGRTAYLRISLDAATGPTHELLRRGARWPVMEANLAFAAELRAKGLIDRLEFAFTVQTENYSEMGATIDLAHRHGADAVAFGRLTNWGTFSAEQYAEKAVFMPSHPLHADFLQHMRDPRLADAKAALNDLGSFAHASARA